MSLRRINYPLIIGTIILILLLLVSMYPDSFSMADPYGKQRLEYANEGGKSVIVTPPVPPCKEYPWGTDHLGRDLRSLIIYGCKRTMVLALIIALGRLLIALPLAILAAYKNKAAAWFIKQFNVIFSAFPLIIIVLALTKIKFFTDVFTDGMTVTAFILIVLGWSKLAHLLEKDVEKVLKQEFIEGEIAIGKNKWEIAIQNILPHIIPSIVIQFFLEVAMVLLILAQLGLIGLLLGGGYYDPETKELRVPQEFDWPSLLIFSNLLFGTDKMWLVLYPSMAFAVSIIGFNLYGEGLRIEFEKRNSKVITFIRRLPSLVSPVRLVYEVQHFKDNKKRVYQKVALYMAILLIIFFPQPRSMCDFNTVAAMSSINELKSTKYQGPVDGSRNSTAIADYLSEQMKNSGLQPFEGSFRHAIKIEDERQHFRKSEMSAIGKDGSSISLKMGYDYTLNNFFYTKGTYKMEVLTVSQLNKISSMERYLEIHDEAVVVDTRKMNPGELNLVAYTVYRFEPRVCIMIGDWERGKPQTRIFNPDSGNDATITISVCLETGEKLLQMGKDSKLSVNVSSTNYPYRSGINVLGCIPGTDEKLKNEYIIVGSHIDVELDDMDIVDSGELKYGGTALQLQMAKALVQSGLKPKRTIVFAFWDGPLGYSRGSAQFVEDYFSHHPEKKAVYFDLRSFASMRADKLIMDTSRTVPKNKVTQDYVKALKKYAARNDVELIYGTVYSPNSEDFRGSNKESIVMENNIEKSRYGKAYNDINFIDKEKLDNIGQMLLDTIIDIAKIN